MCPKLVLCRAILSGDLDLGALEAVRDGFQSRKHGRDHDVTMVRVGDEWLERESGLHSLAENLVHLPVAGDDGTSTHLLSKASTPGSLSPARNSSVAPPPVEMCEILS